MKYEEPIIKIFSWEQKDIITLSGEQSGDDNFVDGDWSN